MRLPASIYAAAPYERFVREHSPLMAALVVAIVAVLVVRLVVRTMTRFVILGVLTLLVTFVFIERHNISECTQSCSCQLAGVDFELPGCDPASLS